MTTASVVICCYTERRWDDIVRAIASLGEQTLASNEILLVVDHNPELAKQAAKAFANVHVVPNTHRKGLSGARNTGVELASGEIVAFLDDDATADPKWLERLLAPYTDPDVAAVGGKAIPVWPNGSAPKHLPPELYWVVGCTYEGQPIELAEVRNVMGSTMSFRRELIVRLGGFAEQIGRTAAIPLGCEETELCIRLRQRVPGAKILLQPEATVRHTVTADRVGWRYLARRSFSEGRSKAAISRLIGRQDALSTEQSYVRSVIPRALTSKPATAGGLLLALGAAGIGYLTARSRPEVSVPVELCTIDLREPADLPTGRDARVLVRDGKQTLGELRIGPRDQLGIEYRLAGLTPPDTLPPAPSKLPRVSVVLATANRPEHAAKCVQSILDTGYPDLEILVVDNGMRPSRSLDDGRVRYLREPRPGASRARNLGAREATSSVLAFTDDDATVDQHWLTGLVADLVDQETDCVTGLVLPQRLDTKAQAWFESFGGFGKGYRRRVFGPNQPAPNALYPFSPGIFGSGNNMAWRRDAFLDLGGFDERLGPGRRTKAGEDLDLFLRLILSGGRLSYTPHALVWHEHRRSIKELRRQLRGYGTGLASMFLLHAARPGGAKEIARRLPAGLRLVIKPEARGDGDRAPGLPRQFVLDELRGMAMAPISLFLENRKR